MVVAWLRPAPKDEILAAHIQQFADHLAGALDQQSVLTGYTGTGVAVKIRASDPAATPIQVRSAADDRSLFEIHNTDGTILGGLQSGTASTPSLGFVAEAGLGLYRYGPAVLGVATGDPTASFVTFGAGASTTGLVHVRQGVAAGATTVLAKPGIWVQQGVLGAEVDNASGAGLYVQSWVDTREGGGGYQAGGIAEYATKGKGGVVSGFNVTATARDTWGTGNTGQAKTIIGGRWTAQATTGLPGIQSATPFLVTARGENSGDLIQGMEITVAGLPTGNSTPGQRLGVIITTEDLGRSRRGTSVDALVMLGRKAPNDTDVANVQPWVTGILAGNGAGTPARWPFAADSAWLRADSALPAGGVNVLGAVVDMHNTSMVQAYIRGGTGNPQFCLDFSGLSTVQDSIIKVGTGAGVIFQVIGNGGWTGIGTGPTAAPLHIKTTNVQLMAFEGTGLPFVSTTASTTAGGSTLPALAAGYLIMMIGGIQRKVPFFAS